MATLLHLQDTFSRYAITLFICSKKKERQTAAKVANVILTQLIDFFGTPGIAIADKDTLVTVAKFLQFRRGRNVALQTVIHRHRRSLRDT